MGCQTKKMSLFRPNAEFYKFGTQAILLYSSLKILQWHYNQIQPRNKKNIYHAKAVLENKKFALYFLKY